MSNSLEQNSAVAAPGALVTFGAYAQTADGTDRTPIRWRVLQNSESKLFLLSEYLLDCRRYHGEYTDTTWRDCDLRQWLNETFYNAAFTAAEKARIQTTRCADNGANSPDTDDRVFLLSVAEADRLTVKRAANPSETERRAVGTEFARVTKPDGCQLYVYDKGGESDYFVEDGRVQGCSWWWLRTRGTTRSRAVFVGTRASIRSYGRVSLRYYGVRPALKLTLP